jgi:hypothetical protein
VRPALALVLVAGVLSGAASAQETQQDIADRIVREQQDLRYRQMAKVLTAPDRAMSAGTLQPYTVEAPGGSGPAAPKPAPPPKKDSGFPMWILVAGGILLVPVLVSMSSRKKPPAQRF